MTHLSFLTLVFVSMWPSASTDSGILPLKEWRAFLANESMVDPEVSIEAHTRTYLRSIGPFTKKLFTDLTGGAPVHCVYGACTVSFCWSVSGGQGRCLTTAHLTIPEKCLNDEARAQEHEIACKRNTTKRRVNVTLMGNEHSLSIIEHHPHALVDALVFQAPVSFSSWSVMPPMHQRPIKGYIVPQQGDVVWVVAHLSGLKYAKVAAAPLDGLITLENLQVQRGDSGAAVCHGQSTTECILVGMLTSFTPEIEAGYVVSVSTLIQTVGSLKEAFKSMPQVARFADQVAHLNHENARVNQEVREYLRVILAVGRAMDGFSTENEPMKSIAQVLKDFTP